MRVAVTPEHGHRDDVAIFGHAIITDQRVSGGGYHEGPTPTELFVASLAGCVAFYVGGFLRPHSLAEGGFGVDADFRMSEDAPARVAPIDLRLSLPEGWSDDLAAAVYRVAERCTVHNSLMVPPTAGSRLRRRNPRRSRRPDPRRSRRRALGSRP